MTAETTPTLPPYSPFPPLPASPPSRFRPGFQSPLSRLVLIALLLLVLMIPAAHLGGVGAEGEGRRAEAVADITGKWGAAQTLTGPILRVPYRVRYVEKDAQGQSTEKFSTEYAFFLPKTLHTEARMEVETRTRGIFAVPVYRLKLRLIGQFGAAALAELSLNAASLDLPHAELLLGVADPRALHADAALRFNGKTVTLKPAGDAITGVRAAVGDALPPDGLWDGAAFELGVTLNGSEALSFTPMAEETRVSLSGNWPHPSFDGAWLPAERQINAEGFSANWSVSYLGRNVAQQWRKAEGSFDAKQVQGFGVSLHAPVDTYSMAERICKYALLALVFTFAVIWLMEVLTGVRLHPIQYGFIGAALSLFGLLQLSVAEHFGFAAAFGASAVAVVGLVGFYSRAALKSSPRALLVTGVLGGLYGYLYMILQAEDYALLGGSLALFAALAAAMWLTRKIDWQGVAAQNPQSSHLAAE